VVALIAEPAVPETVCVDGVIVGVGAVMLKVIFAVADVPPFAPVTTIVAELVAVGVPLITPVEVFSDKPVGKEPVVTE
jgi:hypothetical protein